MRITKLYLQIEDLEWYAIDKNNNITSVFSPELVKIWKKPWF